MSQPGSFSSIYNSIMDDLSVNLSDILFCGGLYFVAYFMYSVTNLLTEQN